MKKDVFFGLKRFKGGATLVGAFSVRAEKDLASPVIDGGDLVVGKRAKVKLDPGQYWAWLVVMVVENLNGDYGYRVTCDGAVINTQEGDVNTTPSDRDYALIEEWAQITVQ
jgi:hypothetical protein